MARRSSAALASAPDAEAWQSLTWDDVGEWVGLKAVHKGKAYQREGRVKKLAISLDGELLAHVIGTERYVTSVWLADGRPDSRCTCPVGHRCKHAVAVVAEYLQQLADGVEVTEAAQDDRRWSTLDGFEYEGDENDEEDRSDAEEGPTSRRRRTDNSAPRTAAKGNKKIRVYLQSLSQQQLADFVLTLVERDPELHQELKERIALGEGDVDRLVKQARREIQNVTSEEAWFDEWDRSGSIPDYGPIQRRLERLAELGYHDHVADLGSELIRAGMEQVASAHDEEGETGQALAECLPVVFRSVLQSSLPACEKILFAINACLDDQCEVLGEEVDLILGHEWEAADWSEVADCLLATISELKPRRDDWHVKYRRDSLGNYLAMALENAGRREEIVPLLQREAAATDNYGRLVRCLLNQQRFDEAEQWARKGIQKTRTSAPGIASQLAHQLCDLARQRKQWDIVAAHAAARFFAAPSVPGFNDLLKEARKAKCEKPVREAALAFLETGLSPLASPSQGKRKGAPSWPLPMPEELSLLERSSRPDAPHFDVLLEMALADKRCDDALKWHDRMDETRRSSDWGFTASYSEKVAQAVSKTHPQRALSIYREMLDRALGPAGQSYYDEVARLMRRLRPIYESLQRKDEWLALLSDMRLKYKNRPRFLEALNDVDGRTIVESARKRK